MSVPRAKEGAESVRKNIADVSNVLVLSDTDGPEARDLCPQLLVADDPGETDLLWVTYTSTPDDCLRRWLDHGGERPANLKVISVGDVIRSAAAQPGTTGARSHTAVDSVSNPGDLTGLGITVSEQLRAWSGDSNRTVACYDSLTTALQYVDLQTLYKFLHVLTGRFETVDATAHFHLNPAAHDDATVNTLKSLFDAVVEPDDGGWHVARR